MLRNLIAGSVLCAALLLAVPGTVFAQAGTVSYQGVLTSSSGEPADDGVYGMKFDLFNAETGGTLAWTETHAGILVVGGAFNAPLGGTSAGSASDLAAAVTANANLWLEVTVTPQSGPSQTFTPRVALGSAPTAISTDAEAVTYDNAASGMAADEVQSAVDEMDGRVDALELGGGGGGVGSVFGRSGAVTAQSGDYTATQVTSTATGPIAATNVQAAIAELATEKAATTHTHNLQDLGGSVSDAQVANNITVNLATNATNATNASHAVTADSATTAGHATTADSATNAGNADTLDNLDSTDFALSGHLHNLEDLGGAVTDAQVPDDITVDFATSAGTATTATSATNATNASNADTLDGIDSLGFALSGHSHNLQDLGGAVTDAQVPNNITVNLAADSGTLDGIDSTGFARDYNAPPIGSIIAWHKSAAGTPALPTGWAECNGQTLAEPSSPYNGQALPNLNGAGTSDSGAATKGYFLRGNTTSGVTEQDQDNSLRFVRTDGTDNASVNTDVTVPANGGRVSTSTWYEGSRDSMYFQKWGREVRPRNFSVVWIIRVL